MTAFSLLRPGPPSMTRPTRYSQLVFGAKALLLRTRRGARNLIAGPPRLAKAEAAGFPLLLAESSTALWADEALAERGFQLGKIQNLRIACRALDGLVIPAGAVFSVWRHLGAPIAARGYVPGRMLKQGCMVPSVGGGLCQLSNALYDAALQAGCRIVERHSHSRIVPGSAAAAGRDATLAWNYVDLRFAPDRALRLSARLDCDSLIIRLLAPAETATPASPAEIRFARVPNLSEARSCVSCDEIDCFRHEHGRAAPPQATDRRVFLVDEAWPEFQAHLSDARRPEDRLGLPLDGARLGLARYAWHVGGFAQRTSAPVQTLRRSWALRRAGLQGAARRSADLAATSRIARSLARLLTSEVTSVTLAQSYLPFLWRDGHLGGRQVWVLMTRLPMTLLQARLDAAAAAHPERATLADFRAPAWLAEAEAEALAAADWIITPMPRSPLYSATGRYACPGRFRRHRPALPSAAGGSSFPAPRLRARAPMPCAMRPPPWGWRSCLWGPSWRGRISGEVSAPSRPEIGQALPPWFSRRWWKSSPGVSSEPSPPGFPSSLRRPAASSRGRGYPSSRPETRQP